MNQLLFREEHPKRTCVKKYTSYSKYKDSLANDFNRRCGYTNCHDKWFGGKRTFHIDHFKPQKKYPKLENAYTNLVYACSYVNILKSDDDSSLYLDPCEADYNKYFYRDPIGRIYPKTESPEAQYIYDRLKLGLARYQIIWLLDKLHETKKALQLYFENLSDDQKELEVLRDYYELDKIFTKYFDYLAD